MYKVVDILLNNIDELLEFMMMEIVKDRKSCRLEVFRIVDFIRFIVDIVKNLFGESILGDSFLGFKNNKILIVKRELLGVVFVIFFFNYLINLLVFKIVLGLMVGNLVVLKFVI